MKLTSTNILRGIVILIGLVILGVCVFALPGLIRAEFRENADFDYGWIFVGMYVTAVPFFLGLHRALKLLNYIDKNQAFTERSVEALKDIKFFAFMISALYSAGMPYIFYVADRDDAPGVAAIGFVLIGASFVVATAAAVIQQLFQNAVDIKKENDLTV